jgi:hypothetical protein
MSRKAEKVLGRNDRAFRLIGLRFVVLQLPFCLVREVVPAYPLLLKLMRTGSYFIIGWHSALVLPISRSIASEI